ncbi:hypothetical protein [Bradyrhizobium sp. LMTR 3]|uniref:hypothetical protein n=1 Tax=Bradyrhizobium sp. LMTR 3 TaxID=189873 RepID=UPI00081043DB|nr:hypothetical protein [Bradyrhizobium sp. LMTR 3]OCK56019.1 hypothetical protein LMTR3_34625 [Bradyrhizobium sp. LMTR 3]
MSDQGWDKHAVHARRLHERYILFILLAVLIGVITVKWSDVPKLTEYISFALTLASLLLAIMAIGYAIYSNHGLGLNLASLVSSIGEVKTIASTLSASSVTLSRDIQSLSEQTGGMDRRLAQIAENTRAQELSKQAIQEPAAPLPEPELSLPLEVRAYELDLVRFATVTSTTGRYVLFALTIAFLNKKEINMKELFERGEYQWGFLIATSSADIWDGPTKGYDQVNVESFPGADVGFATKLVALTQASAAESDIDTMPESVAEDFGRMRAYFEDKGFDLHGTLDAFRRVVKKK